MDNPLEIYKYVYQAIDSLERSRIAAERTGCAVPDNNPMQEALSAAVAQITKLRAFINLAQAHTNKLNHKKHPLPIDIRHLSQLAVQIAPDSLQDKNAAELYTLACGQLMTAEQEAHQIRQRFNEAQSAAEAAAAPDQSALKDLQQKTSAYLHSDAFTAFAEVVCNDRAIFQDGSDSGRPLSYISLGTAQAPLPANGELASQILNEAQNVFQGSLTASVPFSVNMTTGGSILLEYNEQTEYKMLSGLQLFLINAVRYFGDSLRRIVFIDPVRMSRAALGVASPLADPECGMIDPVPLSAEEIRTTLSNLVNEIITEERTGQTPEDPRMQLLVFLGFPQNWDSQTAAQIRQIFLNASRFRTIAAVACRYKDNNDMISAMRSAASLCISCDDTGFFVNTPQGALPFVWYQPPQTLPQGIYQYGAASRNTQTDSGNEYGQRIGFDLDHVNPKGTRRTEQIPYGISADGTLQVLDFEDSRFAAFICGAARSGKSTLLHSLITGLIRSNHPDDIEIWLVDFKMTEFSRYIETLPPHIRYIVLDESPELVCDILDQLTERMLKRKSMFMGKWQKLSDVPASKYMPAVYVIIDEFSIMSQVLVDTTTNGRENYILKLQNLLAEGAALGFHFIFASQGFSDGARGLSDFSKQQIQMRIAMKASNAEIRETLSLTETSDSDRSMMEHLEVHHALVRIPQNEKNEHLRLSKVLYIRDNSEQAEMIRAMQQKYSTAPEYSAEEALTYIDKKPLVIDGNRFSSFAEKYEAYIRQNAEQRRSNTDTPVCLLYPGEPRRLMRVFPIEILRSFGENILMIAQVSEQSPALSVLLSSAASEPDKPFTAWSTMRSTFGRALSRLSGSGIRRISFDIREICAEIRMLRRQIEAGEETDRFIITFGLEEIMREMQYSEGSVPQKSAAQADVALECGESFEELMAAAMARKEAGAASPASEDLEDSGIEGPAYNESEPVCDNIYDAREDFKYLLTHGPRLGLHFISVFHTAGEVEQLRMDLSLYRHKIAFRMSRSDASSVMGAACADAVSRLDDHIFRYTNGMDSLAYRPYLHEGLSWAGWSMTGGRTVSDDNDSEEYPM